MRRTHVAPLVSALVFVLAGCSFTGGDDLPDTVITAPGSAADSASSTAPSTTEPPTTTDAAPTPGGPTADVDVAGFACDDDAVTSAISPLGDGLVLKSDVSFTSADGQALCLWGADANQVTLRVQVAVTPLSAADAKARAAQDPDNVRLVGDQRFADAGLIATFGRAGSTAGSAVSVTVTIPRGATAQELSITGSGTSAQTGISETALADAAWQLTGGR